jgi:hypothetical protein
MDNNDQVFTDKQQQTLKKSLDSLSNDMGVNSYDVQKQNQTLLGRLDQISYLYKNKKKQKVGILTGIFGGSNTLVAPGMALALTFTLGVVASQFYNLHYGNQSSGKSADVLRSEATANDIPVTIAVLSQTPVTDRSKYLEAGLRAGLKMQAIQNGGVPTLQVFGLDAANQNQLEFKAITGLSPNQSGSVIFTFTK